jgi:predicted  nucleic acid-binding Zn-ribbon protein
MVSKKPARHSIGMSPEAVAKERAKEAKVKKSTEVETFESLSQELKDANEEIERLKASLAECEDRIEELERS